MPRATKVYRNRIALIFDFDFTIAPSTFEALLSELGYDPVKFREERVKPLVEDEWDTVLAQYHCLIEASRNELDKPVTLELMQQVGAKLPLYDDVETMFDKVRAWTNEAVEDVDVEFYLLTAGMAEIPNATPVAKKFDQVWAGACHFNEDGELIFVKRIVTHPDKIRYLIQLAKGFHLNGSQQPEDIYRDIDEHDYHIPFDQMIYVGDGASDMPAFSLMKDEGGIAIGVVAEGSPDEWRGYQDISPDRRIENLALADYSDGSELMQSIRYAVNSIAERIALRKLGQGE